MARVRAGATRGGGRRFRIAALLCALLAATLGVTASHACQLPQDLLGVARSLSTLPDRSGPISTLQAQRLATRLSGLSERRILTQLEEAGLQSLNAIAVDLLAEAEVIAETARQRRATTVQRLLSTLEEETRIACAASGTSLFQRIQQERPGGVEEEKGQVDWQDVERRLEEDRVLGAGALFMALLGFVSILCIADISLRWGMALIWNRKACRIPAALHLMGRKVAGQVVTLGRGGCRFHPADLLAFNRLSDELEVGTPTLHLAGFAVTVRASVFHEEVMDFRFEVPLTLRIQNAMLRQSTISPYYIRKSRGGGTKATRGICETPEAGVPDLPATDHPAPDPPRAGSDQYSR